VRAALVLAHVVSVFVLSLPEDLANPARWETKNHHDDMAQWARYLHRDPPRFTRDVFELASAYTGTRNVIATPFVPYATFSGSRQGWNMFASPMRHPGEVHVDVEEKGVYRPIFRPHSPDARWRVEQFEEHRFRKFMGRFARGFRPAAFDQLARFLAKQAFADYPAATRVRVALYRYDTLPPSRVARSEQPSGAYEVTRVYSPKDLR
jgi:hypothetical protein